MYIPPGAVYGVRSTRVDLGVQRFAPRAAKPVWAHESFWASINPTISCNHCRCQGDYINCPGKAFTDVEPALAAILLECCILNESSTGTEAAELLPRVQWLELLRVDDPYSREAPTSSWRPFLAKTSSSRTLLKASRIVCNQ
jgi:hypothetical protein